jgi:hypothetical protein
VPCRSLRLSASLSSERHCLRDSTAPSPRKLPSVSRRLMHSEVLGTSSAVPENGWRPDLYCGEAADSPNTGVCLRYPFTTRGINVVAVTAAARQSLSFACHQAIADELTAVRPLTDSGSASRDLAAEKWRYMVAQALLALLAVALPHQGPSVTQGLMCAQRWTHKMLMACSTWHRKYSIPQTYPGHAVDLSISLRW